MESLFNGANAVVVANSLNPSLFRESWLLQQGLLNDDELSPASLFSPTVVSVITPRYNFQVLPNQLQFAPTDVWDSGGVLGEVLLPMLEAIPHTPFRAIGMNYWCQLDPTPLSLEEATVILFKGRENSLCEFFSNADARFGIYASQDIQGTPARLRFEAKPVQLDINGDGPVQQRILLSFNFHCDIHLDVDAPLEKIKGMIASTQRFRTVAEEVCERVLA